MSSTERRCCSFSAFDRSYASNIQDIWWTSGESGWGLNLAQQGSILFAALYTYQANGKPLWLVMSNGAAQSDGSFKGDLFRASGPPFNTVPWTAATLTKVGTMTVTPSRTTVRTGTLTYSVDGVNVTKAIERFTFADLRPDCERAR